MAPKLASRHLAYAPPPVPSFLQKLHSQVNQSRGNINDKRGRRGDDDDEAAPSEFDDLLGIGSSSKSAKREPNSKGGDLSDEEEDEWDGAQVVVLKEGRHLSKEEASKDRRGELSVCSRLALVLTRSRLTAEDEATSAVGAQDGAVAVPQAAPSSSAANRAKAASTSTSVGKKSNDLDDLKKLISSRKDAKEAKGDDMSEEAAKKKRKEEKDKLREEKNKRAKVEKSKRGKGLSFSMDD